MRASKRKIESLLKLDGAARYSFFIKTVADWEEVWGLYSEGWAMAGTDDDERVVPFWPSKELAEICADGEWSGYKPRSIKLEDFISTVLNDLREKNTLPGIFYTPENKGTTPSIERLVADLENELEQY